MKEMEFTISPIGFIRGKEGDQYLEINEKFLPALNGLEGFSHLNILWWCHHLDIPEYREVTECEQPYKNSPPKLGIFATRSPLRPNPIALTPVQVLDVNQKTGIIKIAYIDAEEGSPVLDIKPYYPCADRVREVTVPSWSRNWPEWYEDSAAFDWSAEFVNAR